MMFTLDKLYPEDLYPNDECEECYVNRAQVAIHIGMGHALVEEVSYNVCWDCLAKFKDEVEQEWSHPSFEGELY